MLEYIQELEALNRALAQLQVRKEELTHAIIESLGHEHEGQRSYECDIYKVEVRTPMIYSLNKVMYESGGVYLPDNFDPVRKKTAYEIDKRALSHAMQSSPESVRDALNMLIEKKPGKPSIQIKVRA